MSYNSPGVTAPEQSILPCHSSESVWCTCTIAKYRFDVFHVGNETTWIILKAKMNSLAGSQTNRPKKP